MACSRRQRGRRGNGATALAGQRPTARRRGRGGRRATALPGRRTGER